MRFTEEQLLFIDKVLDYCYKTEEGKPEAFKKINGDLFSNFKDENQQELVQYLEDNDVMKVVVEDYDTDHWVITPNGRKIVGEYDSFSNYFKTENKTERSERWKERRESHYLSIKIFLGWAGIIAFIASVGFNISFYNDISKIKNLIQPKQEKVQTSTDTIPSTQIKVNLQTSKTK